MLVSWESAVRDKEHENPSAESFDECGIERPRTTMKVNQLLKRIFSDSFLLSCSDGSSSGGKSSSKLCLSGFVVVYSENCKELQSSLDVSESEEDAVFCGAACSAGERDLT